MPESPQIPRRNFIKRSLAALAAPAIVPSSVFGSGAPSNRITLGFIGMGKQGTYLMRAFLREKGTQVLAVCDVDRLKLVRAWRMARDYYQSHGIVDPQIMKTKEYRELLARPDIDAVVIATPDHWHGLMTIDAAKAGKDIFCEKPLAHNIAEGKEMVRAVRRYGRVFQTGSMQRANYRFRSACELVRNGYIGEIKHVAVNVGGPPIDCDLPAQPVPEYLDWGRWLGPADWHSYHSELSPHISVDVFPNWRRYKEYGGGGMTDWGAHHFDIAQWGLGMDGSGPVKVTPPDGKEVLDITYEYANGITMSRTGRYDGMDVNGVLFVGTEGKIMVNRGYYRTWPDHLISLKLAPTVTHLYKSNNHYKDFLDSVRSRSNPNCDIEIGYSSVVVCLMGNIAYDVKRPLLFDQEHQRFIDDDEANKLIGRPMGQEWTI